MRKMVDMKRSAEEKAEASMPMGSWEMSDYPPNLSISLTHDDLAKLDLDDDCEPGDMIDIRAMGQVTSVSKTETNGEKCCRVEIQLTHIGLENEETEDGDEPKSRPPTSRAKRYG